MKSLFHLNDSYTNFAVNTESDQRSDSENNYLPFL